MRGSGVDRVVVGGDVSPGSMAIAALAMLRALDVPTSFIVGMVTARCSRPRLGYEQRWAQR